MATEDSGEGGSIDASGNFDPAKGPGLITRSIHVLVAIFITMIFASVLLLAISGVINMLQNLTQ